MTHYPACSKIYNIKSDSLDTPKLNTNNQHSVSNKNTKLLNITNENSNSLSGLLAHYNSDSENEELNEQQPRKLDAKVDYFLHEINKIVPTETKQEHNEKSFAWQECVDESTGFRYYWNTVTNDVTWEMPEELRTWSSQNNFAKTKKNDVLDSNNKQHLKENKEIINTKLEQVAAKKHKIVKKKMRKNSSESEDEKIVMITSFSEESSSESDNDNKKSAKTVDTPIKREQLIQMGPHFEDIPKENIDISDLNEIVNKKEIIEHVKEEKLDETVILSRLRTQAKVLHELGGDKSVISDVTNALKVQSLALVAGYGNDSEPEDDPPAPLLFPIVTNESMEITNEHSQSTLFPATKPIDIKQFELPSNKQQTYPPTTDDNNESLVDNKVFKRKRRLGIAFDVPKIEKRVKISDNLSDAELNSEERKGFGFQKEANANSESKKTDQSFGKSGIAFVKADTLNPTPTEQKTEPFNSETEENSDDFDKIKEVVSEKVNFLGEGKEPVSAVQIMGIQLQTLELAYKDGGLTQKYLYSWLRQTFVDLSKLEEDAAPDGWLCQWDRSNKRYYYRNVQTGETQWEYPETREPDIVGGAEAMDICTTPPPNEEQEQVVSSSPKFTNDDGIPSPPPPPVITSVKKQHSDEIQPPIPTAPPPADVAPPPPPTITVSESQPLPPGVDSSDLSPFTSKTKETETSTKSDLKDSLGFELDSFYSDIALLEVAATSKSEMAKIDVDIASPSTSADSTVSDVKKKKKPKSKLGQGINMKKKAVSTLVEKWKKVQNDYL